MTEPHLENDLQNALTSPSYRDKNEPSAINRETLNTEQLQTAFNELVVKDNLVKFPRYDRLYADPQIPNQNICLHSFVPSKGATPDTDGVYGMIKIRGVFATEQEANDRAEFLIRNNDSYHKIYHSYVGRPIPLTHNSRYVAEAKEVDINSKVSKVMNEDVKEKKAMEKQMVEDIKNREQKLLQDSKKTEEDVDPEEKYTTARVKKAQLIWTYLESLKKVEDMKKLIVSARNLVEEMDKQYPDFNKSYFEKYKRAREDAGIPMDDNSFIKYMVEDADLGF
jgi:hypothetical protein